MTICCSSRQRRLLATAILMAASGSAWALLPTDGAPQLNLFIPGSQSNDPNFVPALCLDDTIHVYFGNQGGTISNNDYWAAYCYTDRSKIPGLTAGDAGQNNRTRLWISRRRAGASFIGLDAVNTDKTLTYLTDPSVCTLEAGDFVSAGVTFHYDGHCAYPTAAAGQTAVATAATSDTTPDVAKGTDNVPAGYAGIDPSVFTGGNRVLGGHIIGIGVTLQLRNALQFAGILNGGITKDSLGADCDVGSEDKDCQPSLSKQQLVSLFSGRTPTWSSYFYVNVPAANKYSVPAGTYDLYTLVTDHHSQWAGTGTSALNAPLDDKVHLCRRENGAGQQVAVLANILQSPCLGANAIALAQPTNTTADVGYATSLGAVDNCLKDYNDGTNGWFGTTTNSGRTPPYPDPPATTVPHGDQWAIGMQTTERNANRGTNYRFIKIDGALATGEQVYLGHYPLVGEYALAWKNTVSADQQRALTALANYSQTPAAVVARNNQFSNHSWGQAGYVALANNGYQAPQSWDASNPVTPYTHNIAGNANACAIPIIDPDYGSAELR